MKLPLKPVLCLAFVLGTSAVSHAATINFATAQDWAGESDVLSTGVLNYAYTWTNAARTVNGTPFAGTNVFNGAVGGGNITLAGLSAVNGTAFNNTTQNPFLGLPSNYRSLLIGAAYNSPPTGGTVAANATVTLNNLIVGGNYRVQIWIGDPRAGTTTTRAALLTSGVNSVSIDYNVGNVGGGVGQYVIGSFVADATTQSFTIGGAISNQINAIQVRALVGKWSGTVSGNWDNDSLNFSGASFLTAGAGGFVEFGDKDGSDADVTQTNLTIQPGGVSGATALFTNNNINYTLASSDANGLTGTRGLNKNGSGTLTLNGANTYTGDTALSGGTLILGNPAALSNSTLNFTGGVFTFGPVTTATFGGLRGNQALFLENLPAVPLASPVPVALTVGGNNQSTTYSGNLAGPGTLTKTGAGTLTLTGSLSHAGTTLTDGTLIAGPDVHPSSPITVTGGTLTYQNNTANLISLPAYSQSGGTLVLDLNSDTSDQLNVSGNVDLNGATIRINAISPPALNTPYVLFTYGGTLTGTPTIALDTRHTYTLNRGTGSNSEVTITFTSSSADLVWTGSADNQWVADPRTNWLKGAAPDRFFPTDIVRFEDSATVFDVAIPAGTDVVPGPVLFNHSTNNYSLSGGRIAGPAVLTKQGSGTLTLSSANAHTGGTTVEAGTMIASVAGSLGTGPLTVNGTLNMTSAGATYTGLSNSLSGSGTLNITLGTGTTTNLVNGNNSAFAGTVNVGVGAVAGAGKIQLNGATGSAATFNVQPNATIYVAASVTHQAALFLNGGDMGETLGQIRLEANAVWAGPVTLAADPAPITDATVGSNSGSGTISGNISESGGVRSLIKGGAGTTVLSGDNSFSGPVILNAGRLHAGSNNALGAGTNVTVKAATALQINDGVTITGKTVRLTGNGNGTADFNGALTGGAGSTGGTWAGTVILDDTAANTPRIGSVAGGTLIISGPIQNGTGTNLTISAGTGGTGTVVLSAPAGSNTWTGLTNLVRGILVLGADNSLPVTTILDVDSASAVLDPATFDLRGFSQTVAGLRDTATTNVNSIVTNSLETPSTFTLNNSAAYTYDGVFSGNLSVVKKGAGALTLSGLHTYTGNLSVEAGTLTISAAGLPDAGDVFITGTGTLNLTHVETDTIDQLEIDGVAQSAGVWGSLASVADNKTARITGTGLLLVQNGPSASAFSTWIDNYITLTNPTDKTPAADPDGDGFSNFAEFSFGGSPVSGASTGAPLITAVDTDNNSVAEAILTIAVREGAVFSNDPEPAAVIDGIRYTIQGSLDPATFGQAGSPAVTPLGVWPPGAGGPEAPGGYSWQRFRLSGSEGLTGRGYLRAKGVPAS